MARVHARVLRFRDSISGTAQDRYHRERMRDFHYARILSSLRTYVTKSGECTSLLFVSRQIQGPVQ